MNQSTLERFEAWCWCPRCSLFEVHALRPSRDIRSGLPSPIGDEVSAMSGWSEEAIRRQLAFNESRAKSKSEVIRTCKCGHQWRQS